MDTGRQLGDGWQNAHPGEWYRAASRPTAQPLNANLKAYAAWHLWARLAGLGRELIPVLRP